MVQQFVPLSGGSEKPVPPRSAEWTVEQSTDTLGEDLKLHPGSYGERRSASFRARPELILKLIWSHFQEAEIGQILWKQRCNTLRVFAEWPETGPGTSYKSKTSIWNWMKKVISLHVNLMSHHNGTTSDTVKTPDSWIWCFIALAFLKWFPGN